MTPSALGGLSMSSFKNLPFLQSGGTVLSDKDIRLALKEKYLKIKSPAGMNKPNNLNLYDSHKCAIIFIFKL